MHKSIKALIATMLNKRIIGGKHIPEDYIVKSKIKWLNKEEYCEFQIGYSNLINNQYLFRTKKRTGKGSGWHISLNPRKLKEVYEMIENE